MIKRIPSINDFFVLTTFQNYPDTKWKFWKVEKDRVIVFLCSLISFKVERFEQELSVSNCVCLKHLHALLWVTVCMPLLQQEDMEDFLMVLVLCHNIRVEHAAAAQLGSEAATMYSYSGFDYEYQASSPDEKAFVEACRRYDIICILCTRL